MGNFSRKSNTAISSSIKIVSAFVAILALFIRVLCFQSIPQKFLGLSRTKTFDNCFLELQVNISREIAAVRIVGNSVHSEK